MVRSISVGAADQRVDTPVAGLAVQVDAVGIQRLAALAHDLFGIGILVGAIDGAALLVALGLGDAVGDVVHRIQARHLLLLQVVDGVALALGEHGHQHVGAGHLLPAGGLYVDRRALQHALEAGSRLGVAELCGDQARQLIVDVIEDVGTQAFEIDAAGPQHRHGVRDHRPGPGADVPASRIRGAVRWRPPGHGEASALDWPIASDLYSFSRVH